jgi:FtsH-binding integral membrane protein
MIPAATLGRSEAVHVVAKYDRIFYGGMGVLLAAVAVAGFAPTFYLRSWFGAPPTIAGATELTPLAYLHGAVSTAWMVLFTVQTSLIASRRVKVHRSLGVAGVVLAVVMIIVGYMTAIAAARRGAAPPGAESLPFLVVPLFDLVLFAVFVTAAVVRRRDKESHKRLMLLAYISIIAAGVARLPGMMPYGPFVFFGIAYGFSLLGAAYDQWSRRKVHRVYYWGIPLLLISVPGRLMLSTTDAWRSFAEFLTR